MPKLLNANHLLKNRYRIQSVIGQGGMGAIYLANDERLSGRKCAIKEVEQDPGLPEKLQQEARDARMMEAEKKAASLQPKLTVPMIIFFLPVLFAVILTPAIIQISGNHY